ncbi:hypothetical protein V0288_18690 [Pannus brasiliensis CCIBt3594]|uniref:Uncharacterized protein n=1 Tax=Pannus brasiliensis CCIBt3594 TaxID=1427578 RepID=A0AAW9QZI7_9CHRO
MTKITVHPDIKAGIPTNEPAKTKWNLGGTVAGIVGGWLVGAWLGGVFLTKLVETTPTANPGILFKNVLIGGTIVSILSGLSGFAIDRRDHQRAIQKVNSPVDGKRSIE